MSLFTNVYFYLTDFYCALLRFFLLMSLSLAMVNSSSFIEVSFNILIYICLLKNTLNVCCELEHIYTYMDLCI
jgi:hypothetical protein